MNLSGILIAGMVGLFILALGFVVIFILYQAKISARDLQQQKMENEYQKNLLQATIDNQEAERKRIASDLHDEIGALLSTSRRYFNQLSPGLAEEQLGEVSSKINTLFDEMMLNIRRISHDMRPVVLEDFGLREAIEGIQLKLMEAGMNCSFSYQLPFKMKANAELAFYRIIQELVNNTLKHGHATAIELAIMKKSGEVLLTYADNGIGFELHEKKGLGLKSIESRLSLLDASMEKLNETPGVHYLIRIKSSQLAI
ncbi:hypothetical protein WSM22_37180 [Cytophagales bacterium WSM2-2]|nr:hypothetical protein WSM22_37180 [Cytophagales bacterium WSM2-2]